MSGLGRGELVRFVVEVHDRPCSHCHAAGWNKAIWLNVRWVSGANPPGPPALVLCDQCFADAEVGVVVG